MALDLGNLEGAHVYGLWFFLGDDFSATLGSTVLPFCVSLRGLLLFVARGHYFYAPLYLAAFRSSRRPKSTRRGIFLGDPFRKRSHIQRFLVRLWIHVASVYRGFWGILRCVKVDSDPACRCATTGAHGPRSSLHAALGVDNGCTAGFAGFDAPRAVLWWYRRTENCGVPQLQFLDDVVDMPVIVPTLVQTRRKLRSCWQLQFLDKVCIPVALWEVPQSQSIAELVDILFGNIDRYAQC